MTVPLSESDRPLVARIRKLLDKAEHTDNPHESEVFSAKAADLIARHRIAPDRLVDGHGSSGELTVHQVAVGRGAYVRGRISLLGNLAEAHDVRMVFQSTPTGTVAMLAGRREDIDVVEVMYSSLHAQAASQMAGIRSSTGASTQRERRGFLFGFAHRIGQILDEARSAAEAEAKLAPDSAVAMALVIRERRDQVDEFAEATWGRVRSAGRPRAVAPDGYIRGGAAAERADVGRPRLGGRSAIGRGS